MAKSVLILEDSATQAIIIGKMFERAGYNPVFTTDPSGAVSALKTQAFDLLVLDVYTPAGDTLEHLDIYRGMAPQTPIAIMTAGRREDPLAASAALNRARRAKVDFLLPKPFHYDDVLQICQDTARIAAGRASGAPASLFL